MFTTIRRFTTRIGLGERRKDGRVPASGLDVSYWTGLEQKRAGIRDISPTGIYLLTQENWLPGTNIQLILQRKGLLNHFSRPQVRLLARTVRQGDDGVGLAFVHEHVDDDAWLQLMGNASTLGISGDAVHLFRLTKALAFLQRIAPADEDRVLKFVTEDLVHERAERAIEIALRAEEILNHQCLTPPTDVSADLLIRILEIGSKVNREEMEQCWAGMLASAFVEGTSDEESLFYVEQLSRLDVFHVLILAAGSTRALQMGWKSGPVFPRNIACPAEEMRKLTAKQDLAAIERDLHHLYALGLLELTVKEIPFTYIESANITPTALGMSLYARCSGQVGVWKAAESQMMAMEIAS